MKKTRKVTEMGKLITRGEYVANVKANNERIAQVFLAYEERLRRMEALIEPPKLVQMMGDAIDGLPPGSITAIPVETPEATGGLVRYFDERSREAVPTDSEGAEVPA